MKNEICKHCGKTEEVINNLENKYYNLDEWFMSAEIEEDLIGFKTQFNKFKEDLLNTIKEIEKEVFLINHAELMSKQEKERLEIIKDFLYRLNNIDSDGDLRILEQGDKNDNQYI